MKITCIGATCSQQKAGLAADYKTLKVLKAKSHLIKCGTTIQSSQGKVLKVIPIPISQLQDDLAMINSKAVKIGAMLTLKNGDVIAKKMARLKCPKVLDPVLMASGGGKPLNSRSRTIWRKLLPVVDVVTPNLAEGEFLSGKTKPEDIVKSLIQKGAKAVLLKGGHMVPFRGDLLATATELVWLESKDLKINCRATGCTLATALAFYMTQQNTLKEAVCRARELLRQGIQTSKNGIIWAHINCPPAL